MVMARIHIICGNCGNGNGDDFEYEINPEGHDFGDDGFKPAVWIWCKNCSTLHDLSEKIPEKKIN